ncbi:unnamed protein product [Symbiodinium necroappetens]|uniref:Uncharacterized protein n=1 Tax=Symbiodinium necroappetens TaxID=1628268 RepID=A0A812Z475_9DINO|nr:unnamed protein product [Symbiodinium necroappetens]
MDKGEQGSHEKNHQHPCGRAISTAPDILKATYDTSVHFTWGLASFNCLRSFPFQDDCLYDRLSQLLSQLPARQSVPQKYQVLLEQFTIERGYAHVLLNPYIVNGVARGCTLQSFADSSPEWNGWMLPVQQDGSLLHIAFYAGDVASFAESFMKKTGLMKMGQKQLPIAAAGQWNMTLVEGCFFRERFTKEFVDLLSSCGIRLHVLSAPVLRMDQLKLATELEGGNSQWWASLPQEESKFPGSVWVTAEGFFYTLARKIFPTCSKSFVTPVYTMQAEVLKSDLYESDGDFKFTRKREVGVGWIGDTSVDWGFGLDGYTFVPCSHVCLSVHGSHRNIV